MHIVMQDATQLHRGVTMPAPERRTAQAVVRLKPSLMKVIDAEARKERRTKSNLIEEILESWAEKKKPA